ncbi:recombination associated protein [Legionella busanensis]|uniref:Recombination-associated protein RdgC n=1 Tax=Legionella busanensis TaxID=190655 RepID=A0A378JM97_9GAMM|nr:recombination-associated protein RdgC [Legionella busanensis]STX51861.1 recombination associated protein [Legionella busanensis]
MWFNNALIYHYELADEKLDFAPLLVEEKLKPCPPHARFIYGWLPVSGEELTCEVAGALLLCLGKTERILPRSVINQVVAERILQLETQHGRKIKRSEKAQLTEEVEFELLPKSFCIQKRLLAILDTQAKRLIINTASENQASQLTSLLRKTLPKVQLEPLSHSDNLALRFAEWITNPATLPAPFQLASDCLLFAMDDEKKRITCRGYELPSEEIVTLLTQGLAAAEISLIWNERIQFTLTHDLTFKRLKSLDYLIDEFNDINQLEEDYLKQDASLTLLCGELRQLVDDLMKGLNNKSNRAFAKEHELAAELI